MNNATKALIAETRQLLWENGFYNRAKEENMAQQEHYERVEPCSKKARVKEEESPTAAATEWPEKLVLC